MNPNDMKNNCVSVSVARSNHYRDVEELWKDVYGYSLPDRALKFPEILKLLEGTEYDYGWMKFVANSKETAYQVFDSTEYTGNPYDTISTADDEMLLCYKRKNGTGHCVNYLRKGRSALVHAKAERIFLDFQRDQNGDSGPRLRADIEAAEKIIILFSMKYNGKDWHGALAKQGARRQALIDAGLTPAWAW